MHDMARLHAIAVGEVQGVGFRIFVQQRCRILRLTGWVRNCADGTVEIIAEGERSELRILLGDLNIGPRAASVERVDYNFEEYTGSFHNFTIQ
jgi:acylphosphatase